MIFVSSAANGSGAAAQAEIECRVGGGTVKATPEMCAKLGGAGPAAAAPQASEQSAAQLYATWEQHRRSDHAKAHAAAKEYVGRFPAEAEAEKLRAWIAAYEKARDDVEQQATAASASRASATAAAEKELVDSLLASRKHTTAEATKKRHPVLDAFVKRCVLVTAHLTREGEILERVFPAGELDPDVHSYFATDDGGVNLLVYVRGNSPTTRTDKLNYAWYDATLYANAGTEDEPKRGRILKTFKRGRSNALFPTWFPNREMGERFRSALRKYLEICN